MVCVCACVCVRLRARMRKAERGMLRGKERCKQVKLDDASNGRFQEILDQHLIRGRKGSPADAVYPTWTDLAFWDETVRTSKLGGTGVVAQSSSLVNMLWCWTIESSCGHLVASLAGLRGRQTAPLCADRLCFETTRHVARAIRRRCGMSQICSSFKLDPSKASDADRGG